MVPGSSICTAKKNERREGEQKRPRSNKAGVDFSFQQHAVSMTKRTPRLPEMSAAECREQLLKPFDALPVTQTGGGGRVEGGGAHEAYCDTRNARPEHVGSCLTTEEQRRVFPCMPNMPQHMQPHELPHELRDSAVSNGPHTDSDSSSTVPRRRPRKDEGAARIGNVVIWWVGVGVGCRVCVWRHFILYYEKFDSCSTVASMNLQIISLKTP